VITLGSEGEQLTVILAAGAGFLASLTSSDPWGSVQIYLQLSSGTGDPIIWTATINDVTATFNVTANDVQTAIDGEYSIARLYYVPSGGVPLLWGHGGVRVV